MQLRQRTRQQRTLHRVGELLLLLVEACVVDRERGLAADRLRLLDRLLRDGCVGAERKDRERREHLRRGGNRHHRAGPAAPQERNEPVLRRPDLAQRAPRQHEPLAEPEEPLHGTRAERHGMPEHRADRRLDARIGDAHRTRNDRLAPLVGHPDQRDVDVQDVRDRRRHRLERRLEREALRERARDLVERAQLPRRGTFGVQRALAFVAEPFRLLVELRVLHDDSELRGERDQE